MNYVFKTPSGISIERRQQQLDYQQGIMFLLDDLDTRRGMFLSSGVEEADRYSRWDIGFIDPPLEIVSCDRQFNMQALNERGERLLSILRPLVVASHGARLLDESSRHLLLEVRKLDAIFPEEERSQQPTVFSPIRMIIKEFMGLEDALLGFYGAFGYDLIFQFDPIIFHQDRSDKVKDLHLFLPDQIYAVDRRKETAVRFDYVFSQSEYSTAHASSTIFKPLDTRRSDPAAFLPQPVTSDYADEEFAAVVEQAREHMRVGDIFEIVLHRQFTTAFDSPPSALYRVLHDLNASPYEFVCQFGDEQLIGTSPEMFIRTQADRVESCPISGTVRRGDNPMEDADRIKALYNSVKDEVELTMCTDVDRNDKSRICRPGTVRLLFHRLIESYAGLFHTVDHVEGRLRAGFSGIDALLCHMWAVTLTGSPKKMAVQLIEKLERSARGWYGGAVGILLFNGDVNTGITIRTVQLKDRKAHYRVGATLVYDSKGVEEERETRTKSTAFFHALKCLTVQPTPPYQSRTSGESLAPPQSGTGLRIVLIDYEDSFVHTLADYFRQTGAEVSTYRYLTSLDHLVGLAPHLIVHSPGPGRPADFGVPQAVLHFAKHRIPQFGVCLGLQGIVEAFGGELSVLTVPRHGKQWTVCHDGQGIFEGLPNPCRLGAYHSLYAVRESLPDCLAVLAENEESMIMAVRHRDLQIQAVQFHPESILSMEKNVGHRIIRNIVATISQ